MSITLKLGAPVLKAVTDGQEEVQVADASTLKDVLKRFETQFPGVGKHLYDSSGELKSTYDVYINGKGIDPVALSAKVKDGDEVTVTMFFCFSRSGH
ncbi:MoaD/ThiS family protein [Chloroflexota bacterium]